MRVEAHYGPRPIRLSVADPATLLQEPGTSPDEFAGAFTTAFQGHPQAGYVNNYSPEEIAEKGMQPILTNNGQTGVLVYDHGNGDVEATGLFNTSSIPGAGLSLLKQVIQNNGVNYVECFAPLNDLYAKLGFQDDDVSPWNQEYAPGNWNADHGTPDYHTMRLH